MSSDVFTTVTSESWFGRIKSSFAGVIFGLLMFVGSFVCLWWNEGRAVHTARALIELRGAVVSVEADRVEPNNEGKPVHVSGTAATDMTLTDEKFGISANAIKLRRKVEMYQWQEERKEEKREKLGGRQETVTTYTYSKEWSEQPVNSGAFAQREGHENPGSMRYESELRTASPVSLGAFTLSDRLLSQMGNFEKVSLAADWQVPEVERQSAVIQGDTVYLAHTPSGKVPKPDDPVVGDLRISWQLVPVGPISVIAQQAKSSFSPWQAQSAKGMGTKIERLEIGLRSAEEMVGRMETENLVLTWILRVVGYVVMSFGILVMLQPLAVITSVIPLLGNITRGGIAFFAFFVSFALSMVTIAVAWLAYRPVLAGCLIAAAAGTIGFIVWVVRRRPAATPTPLGP